MQMRKVSSMPSMPADAVLSSNVKPPAGETARDALIRKTKTRIAGPKPTPYGAFGTEGAKLAQTRKAATPAAATVLG